MFELGREIKRLFRPHRTSVFAPPRDGLAGGDPGLEELLDLAMLRAEAKACDVAAGRIGAKDRPMLQLRQAATWREIARRTGEDAALRKAALSADAALGGVNRRSRPDAWARVRLEQAACAMLAVELRNEPGLCAAAGASLTEAIAASPRSPEAAEALVLKAQILAAEALARGEAEQALAAADDACAGVAILEKALRDRPARRRAALARMGRAELLAACGMQLRDLAILERALGDATRASLMLDAAYEPLSWSRAGVLRGEILTAMGETTADPGTLERAVQALAALFEHLTRDHSPLDWAMAQYRLGRALTSLSQVIARPDLLDQARASFDRALVVLKADPGHPLRAAAAQARGAALCLQAKLSGDRIALDSAEAAFRCELAACDPKADPVAWAICQMNLAHIYLIRQSLGRKDKGERVKAAVALDAAIEVFAEQGLKSLADTASASLQQIGASV
jgi:tetratricopeptide (TPR) repeat protein